MMYMDDNEGEVGGKVCTRCKEDWPPDMEFYRSGKKQCRACEYEVKNSAPSRTAEARLAEAERSRRRRHAAVAQRLFGKSESKTLTEREP